VFAYGVLVLLLRLFGRRTTARAHSMSSAVLLATSVLFITPSALFGIGVPLAFGTLFFLAAQLLDERAWIEAGQRTLIS
jgi:hypothetical protein